jgi:hypothetical protein
VKPRPEIDDGDAQNPYTRSFQRPAALMYSRKNLMAIACGMFVCIAITFQNLSGHSVDPVRVLLWSAAGVSLYIFFSSFFGFDPYRSALSDAASPLLQYAERFELRSGIATLSMTLVITVLAKLFDEHYLMTAVASGTLAAWLYFMMRIFAGGYNDSRVSP